MTTSLDFGFNLVESSKYGWVLTMRYDLSEQGPDGLTEDEVNAQVTAACVSDEIDEKKLDGAFAAQPWTGGSFDRKGEVLVQDFVPVGDLCAELQDIETEEAAWEVLGKHVR